MRSTNGFRIVAGEVSSGLPDRDRIFVFPVGESGAYCGPKVLCSSHDPGLTFPQILVGGMAGGMNKLNSLNPLIYQCFRQEFRVP